MITEKSIREAWVRIRTIDNTIPDEVLDFMREASLKELKRLKNIDVFFQSDILPANPTLDQEL